jgi:hypothetical protein
LLPSTEPDRKSFAFDVFPSNILDNIIVMKTGQPNLPSEWAGGLIQLNTQRYTGERTSLTCRTASALPKALLLNPYKTYEGSKTDFLGFDNSVRPLPKNFPGLVALNDLKLTGNNDTLRSLGKTLNNSSWRVKEKKVAYPGQSIQMSGGFALRKMMCNLVVCLHYLMPTIYSIAKAPYPI